MLPDFETCLVAESTIKDNTYVKNNIDTNGVLNRGKVFENILGMYPSSLNELRAADAVCK